MKKIITAAIALLILTGCAENPDSDIVVHKDMEKLIDEAQHTDESKAEIADLQQYDHYTADIKNDSLNVTVRADADVDIPQAEKLSVFRVKQHTFTDADIEPFRQAFFGDAELYDGFLMSQETKADLEPQIANCRERLDEVTAREPKTDDEAHDREIMMQEWQKELNALQERYEAAAFEPELVPTDGKLLNAAEQLASGKNLSYWQWQTGLGCKEAVEMRTADGHASLYVQNNPNYSNSMVFSKTPVGTEFMTVLGGGHYIENAKKKPGSDVPLLDGGLDPNETLTPIPDDSAICEFCGKAAAAMIITKEPGDYGIHNAPDGTKMTRIPAYAFLYLLGHAEKNGFFGRQ